MKIGFFDSGIGGLTVLNQAFKERPWLDYIYYADTANVPYGNKTKEEVRELLFQAVEFLVEKGLDALVVACNTATSAGIEEVRQSFPLPIIGMEPAVKTGLKRNKDKKVLVMATALTLKEDKFKSLINQTGGQDRVESLPMPKLVEWTEEMDFKSDRVRAYIKEALAEYKLEDYSSLVLGCTHFIYYRPLLEEILPDWIEIIDGNKGTVDNLFSKLPQLPAQTGKEQGKISFYSSDKKQDSQKMREYLTYLEKEKI